jgi:hypothetical protein
MATHGRRYAEAKENQQFIYRHTVGCLLLSSLRPMHAAFCHHNAQNRAFTGRTGLHASTLQAQKHTSPQAHSK